MNIDRSSRDEDREIIAESAKRKRFQGEEDVEDEDPTQVKVGRQHQGQMLDVGIGDDQGRPDPSFSSQRKEDVTARILQEARAADAKHQALNNPYAAPLPSRFDENNDALSQALVPGGVQGGLSLGAGGGLNASLVGAGTASQPYSVASRLAPLLDAYGGGFPVLAGMSNRMITNLQGGEESTSEQPAHKQRGLAGGRGPIAAASAALDYIDPTRISQTDPLLAARARILQETHRNSQAQMASLFSGGASSGLLGGFNPQNLALMGRSPLVPNPTMSLLLLQNQMEMASQLQLGAQQQPNLLGAGGIGSLFAPGRLAAGLPPQARAAAAAAPQGAPELPPLEPGQHPPANLYMACDDEILSDHQIFLRQQIEYFEAGTLEVQSATHGRRREIHMGQVGIRCKHCAPLPPRRRPKGAVYYPASLRALYQASQNMAACHFTSSSCDMISDSKRAKFLSFQEGKISAGHGGKKYWSDCATAVNIYETEKGLRFRKTVEKENPPPAADNDE